MDQNIVTSSLPMWQENVQQFQQLLAAGGPVLYVIAGLSVLTLAIILLKLVQFGFLGLGNRTFIDAALAALNAGEPYRALSGLARVRNPFARTLERAIRGQQDSAVDRRDLEEDVARDGAARVVSLRSYLRLLELIATVSPLLGLLGTVLGMIDAFQALEAVGSRVNPAILSGGIWVALLTSAAGLIVAIPAAAAHNILEGNIERAVHSLEDAVTRIMVGSVHETTTPEFPSQEYPRLPVELAY